jgi:hypothetical protein
MPIESFSNIFNELKKLKTENFLFIEHEKQVFEILKTNPENEEFLIKIMGIGDGTPENARVIADFIAKEKQAKKPRRILLMQFEGILERWKKSGIEPAEKINLTSNQSSSEKNAEEQKGFSEYEREFLDGLDAATVKQEPQLPGIENEVKNKDVLEKKVFKKKSSKTQSNVHFMKTDSGKSKNKYRKN